VWGGALEPGLIRKCPWSAKRYLKIALDTELLEDICNENEKSFQHMVGK
jgi:hypothetical protein